MSDSATDARRAPVDRTSLSWQRTVLHSAIVALFAALTAIRLGEPAVAIAAAVLAGFSIVVGATTPRVTRADVERREPWALMLRTVIVLGASAVVGVMLVVAVALEL